MRPHSVSESLTKPEERRGKLMAAKKNAALPVPGAHLYYEVRGGTRTAAAHRWTWRRRHHGRHG
jgi:hypothetical protein